MSHQLLFHPEARLELFRHARYLAEIAPKLSDRFLSSVESKLDAVLDHPQIGPVYWKDFRKLSIPRFKVLILYRVIPGGIGVAAFIDARIDPKRIQRMLRER